jgi:Xaa-Pro aminopeptidase
VDLIRAKIDQAIGILKELDIDLWLIFCRESDMMADPALALVVGHKVVWQSAFFISKKGDTAALVGSYDAPDLIRSKRFERVQTYVEDAGDDFRGIVEALDPQTIAVNFSTDDAAADGLTYGMQQLILRFLEGTPYTGRIISAEKVIFLLRGRKLDEEIRLIAEAARMAEECWRHAVKMIKTGMTEIEIGKIIDATVKKLGGTNSFETIVNAGVKSLPGHGHPTEAILERGDLLHVDFGVRVNGFCSDIQRLAYCIKERELSPPDRLQKAFDTILVVIDKASQLYKPGARGYEIDALARAIIKDSGYPEYKHALGHQIGRSVHDGSAIIGPRWARYGKTPMIPLEKGNVFTVELGVNVDDIGYVGLEEDLAVTENGGRFLCDRQTKLALIR